MNPVTSPDRVTSSATALAGLLAVALCLMPAAGLASGAQDDSPAPTKPGVGDEQAAHSRRMKKVVERVTVSLPNPKGGGAVTRLAEPVYLFDDPARRFNGGGVWAWEQSGRPVALLTLCLTAPSGEGDWLCELTSLANGPVQAVAAGRPWAPSGAGVEPRPFPKAPVPAADAAKRLRQMKELALRVRAFEYDKPPNSEPVRYELRLLPHPVHRYADPSSGVVDGGLFIIAYGRNPEIALLLETRRQGEGQPFWTYGLNRIAAAELHVKIDAAEVWSRERSFGGATQTYTIFSAR